MGRMEYKYIVALVGVFSIFMELIDMTIVNVALPTLSKEFDVESASTIQWVVTGYLISLAIFIPVSGWAGDRFGTKRVFMFALTVFTTASLLCALSPSIEALILSARPFGESSKIVEVLAKGDSSAGEWGRAATNDLVRSKIKIKSLNFMRGRTFLNKFVIIDEAQNLTPKQMKTLITRAGPGTKIVCLGNLAQIDTPYLTEGSSGLTFAVDRFKGWAHSGHVTLARGERSRLADFASEVL